MISKSEDGKIVDRINWDVGVVNKIFMDNAPNQTGYNTEMQRVATMKRMEVRKLELSERLRW